MSIEDFEMIEHPFGYKVEYWDGEAVFTPREYNVTTKLGLLRDDPRNRLILCCPLTPPLKRQ